MEEKNKARIEKGAFHRQMSIKLHVSHKGSTNCGILPSLIGENGKDGKHRPNDFIIQNTLQPVLLCGFGQLRGAIPNSHHNIDCQTQDVPKGCPGTSLIHVRGCSTCPPFMSPCTKHLAPGNLGARCLHLAPDTSP